MSGRRDARRRVAGGTRPNAGLRLEALEAREVPAAIGALDPSFGTGGKVSPDLGATEYLRAVAIQPDGKIVGVGQTNAGGTSDFLVVRFNADGTQDMTFNGGTGKQVIDFGGTDTATAVLTQPDGKIVVAGEGAPALADFCVARLNPDGTFDGSFSGDGKNTYALGGTDHAEALGLQSDGTIIVAGHSDFNSPGTGPNDFTIIRVSGLDGSKIGATKFVDFNNGDDQVVAGHVAVYTSGPRKDQFLVVGQGNTAPLDFVVARLSPDMSTVEKEIEGLGNVDIATDVAIQPDNKILVAGYTNAGGTNDFAAIRLNDNLTTLDTTFNPTGTTPGTVRVDLGGNDIANDALLQPDGKFVITGASDAKGTRAFAAIRLNPDGTLDTTFNATGGADAGKAFVSFSGPSDARGAVRSADGRIVLAGDNNFADVALARLTGTVSRPRNLSVGGAGGATASVFAPTPDNKYAAPATSITPATVFTGFTGEVRTATGDFNGDGVPDTVMVTGPGTKTVMAIVSGKDNSVLMGPTDPFGDANFTFGGFVTAGDLNGDGVSEWVVTPELRGGPRVVIFDLSGSTFKLVANFFGIGDPAFRDGDRAAVGDLNGDGVLDVFSTAAFNGGPRTALYDGKDVLVAMSLGRDPNKLIANDFFGTTTGTDDGRGGRAIAAGDVNGDGVADFIITGDNLLGTGNQVTVFSGADLTGGKLPGFGATPLANFAVGGQPGGATVSVASVDLDGDNRADLVVGSGAGQGALVKAYYGKDLAAGPEPTSFTLTPFAGTTANGVFVG